MSAGGFNYSGYNIGIGNSSGYGNGYGSGNDIGVLQNQINQCQ